MLSVLLILSCISACSSQYPYISDFDYDYRLNNYYKHQPFLDYGYWVNDLLPVATHVAGKKFHYLKNFYFRPYRYMLPAQNIYFVYPRRLNYVVPQPYSQQFNPFYNYESGRYFMKPTTVIHRIPVSKPPLKMYPLVLPIEYPINHYNPYQQGYQYGRFDPQPFMPLYSYEPGHYQDQNIFISYLQAHPPRPNPGGINGLPANELQLQKEKDSKYDKEQNLQPQNVKYDINPTSHTDGFIYSGSTDTPQKPVPLLVDDNLPTETENAVTPIVSTNQNILNASYVPPLVEKNFNVVKSENSHAHYKNYVLETQGGSQTFHHSQTSSSQSKEIAQDSGSLQTMKQNSPSLANKEELDSRILNGRTPMSIDDEMANAIKNTNSNDDNFTSLDSTVDPTGSLVGGPNKVVKFKNLKDKIRANTLLVTISLDKVFEKYTNDTRTARKSAKGSTRENRVRKSINMKVRNVLLALNSDIKNLAQITDDKTRSAHEVADCLSLAKMKSIVMAFVDEKNPPAYVNKLSQELSKAAQTRIKVLFGVL